MSSVDCGVVMVAMASPLSAAWNSGGCCLDWAVDILGLCGKDPGRTNPWTVKKKDTDKAIKVRFLDTYDMVLLDSRQAVFCAVSSSCVFTAATVPWSDPKVL